MLKCRLLGESDKKLYHKKFGALQNRREFRQIDTTYPIGRKVRIYRHKDTVMMVSDWQRG